MRGIQPTTAIPGAPRKLSSSCRKRRLTIHKLRLGQSRIFLLTATVRCISFSSFTIQWGIRGSMTDHFSVPFEDLDSTYDLFNFSVGANGTLDSGGTLEPG